MAAESNPIPASGRVKVMSVDQLREDGILRFTFLPSGRTYDLMVNGLSEEIKTDGLWHGLEQKLRDSAAGVKGDEGQAYDLVSAVGNRLVAGEWAKTREGGGTSTSAYWIEAVQRLKVAAGDASWEDKTTAAARLGALPEEKRDALKKHPQVVAMVAQIKAERAAAELERARAGAGDAGSMEDLFAI